MEKSSWLRQSPHLHSTPSVFTQQSTVCKCSYWSCGSVRVWGLRSSSTSAVTGMTSTKLSAPALIVLSWVLSRCWLTRCRYCRYCTHWHVSDCCHTVSVTCGVQAGWSVIARGKRGGGYLLGFSDTTDCCWLLLCCGSGWSLYLRRSRLWTSSFMMIFHPTLSSEAQRQQWAQHHNLNNPCSHNFYIPFSTSSKTDSKAKLKCVTAA